MTDRSDAYALPANIMRTMPYTALVAVGSYAAIFACADAAWLEGALLLQDVLNSLFKKLLRKLVGAEVRLLQRPEGAMDSGIYPQHYPQKSTSGGMPSGHSQTSAFLATVLSLEVLHQAGGGAADESLRDGFTHEVPAGALVSCGYAWLVALLVMLSRTRFGGILSVKVDGRVIAHHTPLQVVTGAAIGVLLGIAGVEWHRGRASWPWLVSIVGVLGTVAIAATLQMMLSKQVSSGGESDRSDDGKSVASTAGSAGGIGSSSAATASSGSDSSAGDIELRSRPPPVRLGPVGYERVS